MPENISSLDIQIGNRMRLRRKELGKSQAQIGRDLGISFQQVQKYEHAENRISASRLYEIAALLEVNLDFFFAPSTEVGEDDTEASKLVFRDDLSSTALVMFDRLPGKAPRKAIIAFMATLLKPYGEEATNPEVKSDGGGHD